MTTRALHSILGPRHALLVTVILLMSVSARVAAAGPGFTLAGADVRNDDSGVYVDARFDVRLSREAEDALESGVPLALQMQVRVLRVRDWWWDSELASSDVRTELRYHALSRRYVVMHGDTGEQRTFFRRDAALNAWASMVGHRAIDRVRIQGNGDYVLQVRARLDVDDLPYPLRAVALVSPEWRLASEWYSWPLDG